MNIARTVKVSLRALDRNKMRSFLTALGIIIGVGAVIAMVSIGQGAKLEVEERFESMGTNLLFIRPGSRSYMGRSGGGGSYTNLTEADARAILENCDAVKLISPNVNSRAQVIYQNKNWNTSIYGVGEKYPEIRNWDVETGSFFTESQIRSAQKVAVLGSEVSQNLFEGADPIGQVIRVNKIPFRILGVLESKGEIGGFFNRDDMIAIPYTTAQKRLLGIDHIQSIDVSAVSASRTDEAMRQIEEVLRIRHKIAPGAEDDFNVRDMSDIATSAAESTQILTILLGGIASISLLVGGIGIMNIMLVSVTERTREIGIRKAVGAKRRDILVQFLVEAMTLSLIGGVFGVTLGSIGARVVASLAEQLTTVVSGDIILLSTGVSAAVGLLFGIYPAFRAARLNPIDALRYE